MTTLAKTSPLPATLGALDHERLRRYREHLEFYRGTQWPGRARRGERRLTFNYARALVDKVVSYLMAEHSVQVVADDPADESALRRASIAERALRKVERENGLSELDFETELDCAILGDAAYKVFWDADERTVRVTAPDIQGVYLWRRPDDSVPRRGGRRAVRDDTERLQRPRDRHRVLDGRINGGVARAGTPSSGGESLRLRAVRRLSERTRAEAGLGASATSPP